MLDLRDESALSAQVWRTLESRTQLPKSVQDFLQKNGEGVMADCQRRYARAPLRNIAILMDGDERHACFAKDVSRMGIGFYSPVNLLPRKVLKLWLPHGEIIQLRVTRCRRLASACFEIGTLFHSPSKKTSQQNDA